MTVMIETMHADYEPPAELHREAAPAPAAAESSEAAQVAAAVERELWRVQRLLAD